MAQLFVSIWLKNSLAFTGNMYYEGDSVKKDTGKAYEWYQKSALQGYELAQQKVSRMIDSGEAAGRFY